jgi:ankyrin repeat protein
LSRAAQRGDKAIVELLLQYGAQPDLKDGGGQTPLSRATDADNVMVVELLNSYSCRKRGSSQLR